jgi:hypothetical protein
LAWKNQRPKIDGKKLKMERKRLKIKVEGRSGKHPLFFSL